MSKQTIEQFIIEMGKKYYLVTRGKKAEIDQIAFKTLRETGVPMLYVDDLKPLFSDSVK